VLRRFKRVVIPEMNTGQLAKLIRADFLIDAITISSMRGMPFKARDLEAQLLKII
jgi:2-oxoglutarate/2-oxoacid ferredoxin oxidoreductase subunit alpha